MNNKYKDEVSKDNRYELIKVFKPNEELPNGRKSKHTYFLLLHKYCKSEVLMARTNFIKGVKSPSCCCGSYEKSFAYHIKEELNLDIKDVWDFEKNVVNPYYMSKNSKNKVWIRCEKGVHDSYEVSCDNYSRKNGSRCPYCRGQKRCLFDSFAQYHIENTDPSFLDKYWDWKRNNELGIYPWDISVFTKRKFWVKCQERGYHGSYETNGERFSRGGRCGFCAGSHRTHPLDSFGYYHFDKVMSWHPDNEISPFKAPLNSSKKYKFTCETCGEDFYKRLAEINHQDNWCPKCGVMSKGEEKIRKILLNLECEHEYEKTFDGLVGVGGGLLSYDFYLPKFNLLIEYQGRQHEKYIKGFQSSYEKFTIQKEHDKRKREYAKENNIRLLEIWYYDYKNIEKILEYNLYIDTK